MPSHPKLVQSVFLKVVELPIAERSLFPELECAGDDDLRKSIEAFLVRPTGRLPR